MRRLAYIAALSGLLAALSSGAAAARKPGVNDSGPGGGIWGVMNRQSAAMRVRERAYAPIIRPGDPTLAISCFDRSLALASRLGVIFSDLPPPDIMPPNYAVFNEGRGVYNMYAGLGIRPNPDPTPTETLPDPPPVVPNMLVHAYAGAMANTLDVYFGGLGGVSMPPPYHTHATAGEWAINTADRYMPGTPVEADPDEPPPTVPAGAKVQNFSGSMSAGMGATTIRYLLTYARNVTDVLVNPAAPVNLMALQATLRQDTGTVSQLTAAIVTSLATLETFYTSLTPDDVLLSGIPQYYGELNAVVALKRQIFDEINGPGGIVETYMAALMEPVNFYGDPDFGMIYGKDSSLSGFDWSHIQSMGGTAPGRGGCNTIAQIWRGVPGSGLGMDSIEGGPTAGVPFFTYSDLVAGMPAYASGEVVRQMNADRTALTDARQDLVNMLRAPSGAPTDENQVMLYNELTAQGADAIPPNSLSSWRAPPPPPPKDAPIMAVIGLMP